MTTHMNNMPMNKLLMNKRWLNVALSIAGAGICSTAIAAPYNTWEEPQRAGRWEGAVQLRYQDYEPIRFNSAITLNPSSSWGAGFSVGYNLDPYLNLSFEIVGDSADYHGTVQTGSASSSGTVDGSLDNSTGQFNVTYHWFDSAVTPFVSAGLGWTYIDSRIIKSYAGTECWYHPWYGTVCDDVYKTYNDTMFSYNAALGIRWDLSDNIFMRGSVGRQWIYMDATSSHPAIDFGRLELGMMF